MSCCWDCQYKQNCKRLYEKGEQQQCTFSKVNLSLLKLSLKQKLRAKTSIIARH